MAETFTRQAHNGRINDWHHLCDMPQHQAIEESFVFVLELSEINMFVNRFLEVAEGFVSAFDLFFESIHMRWQESNSIPM